MLKIKLVIGRELDQNIIKFMVDKRIREYGENTKDFENNERGSTFFFLKDENKIKAFGMLKPVVLYFDQNEYQIMGLANVIAVEKNRGYGTILMEHIKTYLGNNRSVCIGNTHKDNFKFYQKCGFTFVPGLVERFVYIDRDDRVHRGDWSDYCMFVYDKDHQLNQLINGVSEIVIRVPLW